MRFQLSPALYSSKSREVWKVIHGVLGPSARPLQFDADELNDFFALTAQRTLKSRATPIEDLTCLIDNLPDDPSGICVFSCRLLSIQVSRARFGKSSTEC